MIWDLILGPLGAIIAAVVGIGGLWFASGRSATVKAQDKRAADDAKAEREAADGGRAGAAKAKAALDAGKTPEQIVRDNDGKWQ